MKYKKYGLFAYLSYIFSYLVVVVLSARINGWGFGLGAFMDIVQFIILPLPICMFVSFIIGLFKRENMLVYFAISMIFISPVGIVINLFAAYLLWWSVINV